jgi:hypothetical protein
MNKSPAGLAMALQIIGAVYLEELVPNGVGITIAMS